MKITTWTHAIFFVLALAWHAPAAAQALVGHLTYAGIEQLGDEAYVVATIEQSFLCEGCPQADEVFVAPLQTPFGQRLSVMLDAALRERRLVTVVLGSCDDTFYGRRRVVSFLVSSSFAPHGPQFGGG